MFRFAANVASVTDPNSPGPSRNEETYVHACLARGLADLGVDTVFGLAGDGNLYIVDGLVRDGVRYVSATHEAAAVLMAHAYAAVSGRLGVATITHGPALTNAVTALTEAARARSGVVVVCGDTPAADSQHLQGIDQRAVVAPTGAGYVRVRSPRSAVEDLGEAVRRATLERRPIVLDVALDLQWETTDYVAPRPTAPPAHRIAPDPQALDAAVGLIASARRPVLLVGRGAVDARDAMLALARRVGAPVATTLLAKDLFRGEPHDLGLFGTLAHSAALDVIGQADLVVVFGAGLNKYTTASGALLTGKRVVQCDLAPEQIGRWRSVDAAVVGDAGASAEAMVDWLDAGEVDPSQYASPAMARRLAEFDPTDEFSDRSTDTTVDLRGALVQLEDVLPADRTVVTDAGRFVHHTFRYLRVPDPRSLVATVAFGSIGLGMGAVVGAGVARPDRLVVGVFGDGGFMMGGLGEFSSAVRHGVDLIALVFNDSAYGSEHVQLHRKNMSTALSRFCWPSLAAVAEALGGTGVTVSNVEELGKVADLVENRAGPLLIEILVDPDVLSSGS